MAKTFNKLSDIEIKNAAAKDKLYKLSDGGNLYLIVEKTGRKYWRMEYRFGGKQDSHGIGAYPKITLKAARQRRDAVTQQLKQGIDPNLERKREKLVAQVAAANTFEAVALEWRDKKAISWSLIVRSALKLSALLFVRPGELRHMEWAEIGLETATWNIPGEKMKMGQPHLVPLSRQALAIIIHLQPLTGRGKYVLPSERGQSRPMSENTVNSALRTLGYAGSVHTAHGFRATARTILDEILEIRPDYIEHQLAHEVKDPNGRAYNRTAHLPARREMMQTWGDYLDRLVMVDH